MNRVVVISLGILIGIIGVFAVLPNAVELLGFSGAKFFGGEVWRILTYPYAHVSSMHLIENVIALSVILLLMVELEFKTKEFSYLFFGTCILAAIVAGLIVPQVMMVGASLGLFALFGGLTSKGKEFLPLYVSYGLFGIIIFLNFVYCLNQGEGFEQPIFHAAGFLGGIVIFKVQDHVWIKKRILQ